MFNAVEQLVLLTLYFSHFIFKLDDSFLISLYLLLHFGLLSQSFLQLVSELVNYLILLLVALFEIKQTDISLYMIPLAESLVVAILNRTRTHINTHLVLSALDKHIEYTVMFHFLFDYVFQNLNVVTLLFVCDGLFS